jgi:hypothetical protein
MELHRTRAARLAEGALLRPRFPFRWTSRFQAESTFRWPALSTIAALPFGPPDSVRIWRWQKWTRTGDSDWDRTIMVVRRSDTSRVRLKSPNGGGCRHRTVGSGTEEAAFGWEGRNPIVRNVVAQIKEAQAAGLIVVKRKNGSTDAFWPNTKSHFLVCANMAIVKDDQAARNADLHWKAPHRPECARVTTRALHHDRVSCFGLFDPSASSGMTRFRF